MSNWVLKSSKIGCFFVRMERCGDLRGRWRKQIHSATKPHNKKNNFVCCIPNVTKGSLTFTMELEFFFCRDAEHFSGSCNLCSYKGFLRNMEHFSMAFLRGIHYFSLETSTEYSPMTSLWLKVVATRFINTNTSLPNTNLTNYQPHQATKYQSHQPTKYQSHQPTNYQPIG